jgi:hypothetical protein
MNWLAFPNRWNLRPKGPCIVVGAFGPFLLIRDFTIGQIALSVISKFPILVFYHSSSFLWVIHLMVLVTQLTVVLHAGSWVLCQNVLNFWFWFKKLSKTGRLLFKFESMTLLVDSLYAIGYKIMCCFYPQVNLNCKWSRYMPRRRLGWEEV